ncbi:HD domain-containing protein [Montanilutibacter psychrotolerans]|uniref:Metal-dependent HD superfamily phosphohydrolase n=1 Tax=Montanilutibacter psychrotolerans TaxID=1327343 RepID=A0A3M8SRQ3_9GAMM|nr:hypothetical protein [Lysobacter psychrotolerans]RNF83365.1 hypothetical protein EER27_11460 [Lysobacter psychrotolerans]
MQRDWPLRIGAEQWSALQTAHATPARAYHHFGHVREVLRHYADVAAGPGWRQPAEVLLAVLYHDAIYQPGRRDNEARSAQLAREHIAHWLHGQVDATRVADLIAMTARHGQIDDAALAADPAIEDARHFLDADMAILGAAPEQFDAYHRGIAAEYRGHVPGPLFRLNRRRFLKALVGRERIFLSEFFHHRYDVQARNNLRRAITEKR